MIKIAHGHSESIIECVAELKFGGNKRLIPLNVVIIDIANVGCLRGDERWEVRVGGEIYSKHECRYEAINVYNEVTKILATSSHIAVLYSKGCE